MSQQIDETYAIIISVVLILIILAFRNEFVLGSYRLKILTVVNNKL